MFLALWRQAQNELAVVAGLRQKENWDPAAEYWAPSATWWQSRPTSPIELTQIDLYGSVKTQDVFLRRDKSFI
jgi:hypothetical protein